MRRKSAFPPHFEEDELEDDEEEELDLPPSTDVVPPPPPPPSTRPPKHQLNRVRDRRKQIDEMQQQLRTRSTPMSRKSYSVKKDLNNTGRVVTDHNSKKSSRSFHSKCRRSTKAILETTKQIESYHNQEEE